tara:strand:+ start:792 stop:1424 length:633 start_codon:yes stop_codon:yes gene_type:complete
LNIKNQKIISVLIAGGKSRRFGGGIKTLTKINGESIFEKIIDVLKKQNTNILINSNYKNEVFHKTNFPIIEDLDNNFQGPLAGIYACMKWLNKKKFNTDWLLTVPSDTPFLPNNLLEIFKSKLKNKTNILIARSNGKIHPIIGMWNISLYKNLKNELKSENRKIMEWVYKNNFDFVDFNNRNYDPFFNINTKEDIVEAQNIDKIIKSSIE